MKHKRPSERHDDKTDTEPGDGERRQRVVARTAGALRSPEPFRSAEEERAAVEQIVANNVVEGMNDS